MAGKIGTLGMIVAVGTFVACVVRIILEAAGAGIPCGCMNIFICEQPVEGTCVNYDFGDINN